MRPLRCFVSGIVALSCSAIACSPAASDMFHLGGAWYGYRHQGLPEAGARQTDIYREWKGRRVLVASGQEFHNYYSGPDCLLWETQARLHVVFAACGEHEPLVIWRDDYHKWTMEPRGLVYEADARVDEQGLPVRRTEMFPLDAIVAASARRPAFSATWRPALARLDANLQRVERDVPIDVNATNDIDQTALIVAAGAHDASASLALVNALIEHGADVNATDRHGITPLMVASDRGHVEAIRRLIAAGAAVNAQTAFGRTALMDAAGALENRFASVTVLLGAGADKSIRDRHGSPAFDKLGTNPDPRLKVLLEVK